MYYIISEVKKRYHEDKSKDAVATLPQDQNAPQVKISPFESPKNNRKKFTKQPSGVSFQLLFKKRYLAKLGNLNLNPANARPTQPNLHITKRDDFKPIPARTAQSQSKKAKYPDSKQQQSRNNRFTTRFSRNA